MDEVQIFPFSGLTGMTAASTVDQKTDICTNGISIFQDLSYYKKWIKKTIRNKLRTCDPGHDSRLLNNNGSSTPQPSQNSSIGVGKISEWTKGIYFIYEINKWIS